MMTPPPFNSLPSNFEDDSELSVIQLKPMATTITNKHKPDDLKSICPNSNTLNVKLSTNTELTPSNENSRATSSLSDLHNEKPNESNFSRGDTLSKIIPSHTYVNYNTKSNVLHLKPTRTGSQTLVELAPHTKINTNTNISEDIKDSNNISIPILRLHVDPLTNNVDFKASKNDYENDKTESNGFKKKLINLPPPTSHSQHATGKNHFIIKKNDSTYVLQEFEDFIEIYDSIPSGVSRGERHSKNGEWTENWLQQKEVITKDGQSIEKKFGTKFGQDYINHKNWSETWNDEGQIKNITRTVLKYDENHKKILEKWNEKQFYDKKSELIRIDKFGEDRTSDTPRLWKSYKYSFKKPNESDKLYIEEFFQEQQSGLQKGHLTRKEDDLIIHKRLWFQECDKGNEHWQEEEFSDISGNKWGEKSGINSKGQNWGEKWFNSTSGDYEIDNWTHEPSNDNNRNSFGEKKGYCSQNDEKYNEKWRFSKSASSQVRYDERKWFQKSCNKQWGEKFETKEFFTHSTSTRGQPQLCKREELIEKWNENNDEYSKYEEQIGTDFSLSHSSLSPYEIKKYKKGNKHGFHFASSQEWNDEWTEQLEFAENNECTTGTPILKLNVKYYDKWWKQHRGDNCWGEKRFEDFSTGSLKEEKWYFNPSEWQIDRWERQKDGLWKGEKHGANNDGTSWNEQWNRDDNSNKNWLEKSWKETKGNQLNQWGESTFKNSSAFNLRKWSETKNSDSSGLFWSEKINDDGFGNVMTEKEGSTWKDNNQVTHWYYDSYGESLGKHEKWAFKKGYEEGSEWLEKWNELPSHKSAAKSGRNKEGDQWSETWEESFQGDKLVKRWAEKQGKNNKGDEWLENWIEENENSKSAFKKASNAQKEMWEEKWGEEFSSDGSGQKWTSKWAKDSLGKYHGNSWGDRWHSDKNSGHHWGEEWSDQNIKKWWFDSSVKPW